MRQLIPTFPRQFANPRRRLVKTETEFYKLINRFNKITNCYYSLYAIDEHGGFQHADIDKIAFDFDGPAAFEDLKKLVKYLDENDIKHCAFYSGKKGFHCYVFTIGYEHLKNPKDTLFNAHKWFEKTCNITNDEHIVGDVARIFRIPNSWHVGGERYCIPLKHYDLTKSWDDAREKAKEQNFEINYYGSKLFDMQQFDVEVSERSHKSVDMPDYVHKIETDDEAVKRFLPCVQNWIHNAKNNQDGCNYEARYYFALYCKEICLPKVVCDDLAEKYFSNKKRSDMFKNDYVHFKRHNVIEYAYREDKMMPNCEKLFEKGLCPGKCWRYEKGNFPLYKK